MLIVPRLGKSPLRISYAELAEMVDRYAAKFSQAVGRDAIIPILAAKTACDAVAAMLSGARLASSNAFASLNRKLKVAATESHRRAGEVWIWTR